MLSWLARGMSPNDRMACWIGSLTLGTLRCSRRKQGELAELSRSVSRFPKTVALTVPGIVA